MNYRRAGVIIAALLLASCGILEPDVQGDGTVRFDPIEGGCWVIDSGGKTYDPLNLSEDLKVDGLRIRFEADLRGDLAHFCPGVIIELTSIEPIS